MNRQTASRSALPPGLRRSDNELPVRLGGMLLASRERRCRLPPENPLRRSLGESQTLSPATMEEVGVLRCRKQREEALDAGGLRIHRAQPSSGRAEPAAPRHRRWRSRSPPPFAHHPGSVSCPGFRAVAKRLWWRPQNRLGSSGPAPSGQGFRALDLALPPPEALPAAAQSNPRAKDRSAMCVHAGRSPPSFWPRPRCRSAAAPASSAPACAIASKCRAQRGGTPEQQCGVHIAVAAGIDMADEARLRPCLAFLSETSLRESPKRHRAGYDAASTVLSLTLAPVRHEVAARRRLSVFTRTSRPRPFRPAPANGRQRHRGSSNSPSMRGWPFLSMAAMARATGCGSPAQGKVRSRSD